MEELDKIIIDSLKGLNCNLDEEITTLKHFDANTTLLSLSTCLEAINPNLKLPKKLPTSLSAKMKTALNVAQQIKDIGFKGDMGYQSILYYNDVDIRRVLIFLIERLPKEKNTVIQIEQTGYVPKIVKKIEEAIAEAMRQGWLPSEILKIGARQSATGNVIVSSFGESAPLSCGNVVIPESTSLSQEDLEQFNHIPDVTKQCKKSQLIPSLLFESNNTDIDLSKLKLSKNSTQNIESLDAIGSLSEPIIDEIKSELNDSCREIEAKKKFEDIYKEIKEHKDNYFSIQEDVNKLEDILKKVHTQKNNEQKILDNLVTKVKLKKKTNAALSNDENIAKLKDLIENASERLTELHKQWDEVQTPLLAERRALQSAVNLEASKFDTIQNKLSRMKQTYSDLVADYKEKVVLEQTLAEKCKELSKKNNRAAYTRRILEIVGNIKKQNVEIQKVLADTKQLQKEINGLTGQVERSFILAEELIFQDASQERKDETAKTSYKLLVSLRDEYEKILSAVTDFGQVERESRNLEDQVENEKSKDMKTKLDKVTNDLAEIKKEIELISKGNDT